MDLTRVEWDEDFNRIRWDGRRKVKMIMNPEY